MAQKLAQFFVRFNFAKISILTDFKNYFTLRIRRKFAIKILQHLNCVAVLYTL